MKNSTILFIFGILGLGGVGAYFYLKSKKAPTLGSVADDTLGLTPKDDTKLLGDLGVKVEEPKPTPYVKPVEGVPLLSAENLQKALLALGIDQTRSITELSSPNFIEAKKLADELKARGAFKSESAYGKVASTVNQQNQIRLKAYNEKTTDYTKRINALGYKLLPNYDIEKM
jgi:hypothetical protein